MRIRPVHLDDEQLQRVLHREQDAETSRSAAEHLRTCGECNARLSEAEREQVEVYGLLRLVDRPPPAITPEQVAARARARDRGWGTWAAGILLAAAAAGAAFAMPGSPLREWTLDARDWIRGGEKPSEPVAPPLMAGLAVPPGDRLVILFERSYPQSKARVALVDGAEVRVRGPSGGATFGTEADTLRIGNRDSTATFEIEIPRDARNLEIRVTGARIFAKDGPRIVVPGADEADSVFLLPLNTP
jgi:hypothetical protein